MFSQVGAWILQVGAWILQVGAWIRRRVGFRGGSLLFFAVVDAAVAFSLTVVPADTSSRPFYRMIATVLPLPLWAGLWWAGALVTLVCVFRIRDMAGFVVSELLLCLWSMLSALDWMVHGSRYWLLSVMFGALAAFTLMESFRDEPRLPVIFLPRPQVPDE